MSFSRLLIGLAMFMAFGVSARAEPVQLPPGWTVLEPDNVLVRIRIKNSPDIVVLGLMPTTDTRGMVNMFIDELSKVGKVEQIFPVQTTSNGLETGSALVRLASGELTLNLASAVGLGNGSIAFAAITTVETQNEQILATRMKLFAGLMQQLRSGRALPGSATPAKTQDAPARQTAVAASRPVGMPPMSNILAVYNSADMIMMGCCLNAVNRTTVIFRNGTACRCLDDWIDDPGLTNYRARNPNGIGRWRAIAGGYAVQYPDRQNADILKKAELILPSLRGRRINRAFHNSQASSLPMGASELTTGTIRTSGVLKLFANGTFSRTASKQVVLSDPSTAAWSGRYTIDGYAIFLEYGNGEREIKPLLTFSDNDTVVVFGGRTFGECMATYRDAKGNLNFGKCRDDE